MRRKITQDIVRAFLRNEETRIGNSAVVSTTLGVDLYLHGNKIATHNGNGELQITNAGYSSQVTKERLNGLPNVKIIQKQGKWFLNGNEWDGKWIKV